MGLFHVTICIPLAVSHSPRVALIESLVHLLLFKIPVVNFAWYSAGVTVQRRILFCSYRRILSVVGALKTERTQHARTHLAATHRVSKCCRCFQRGQTGGSASSRH